MEFTTNRTFLFEKRKNFTDFKSVIWFLIELERKWNDAEWFYGKEKILWKRTQLFMYCNFHESTVSTASFGGVLLCSFSWWFEWKYKNKQQSIPNCLSTDICHLNWNKRKYKKIKANIDSVVLTIDYDQCRFDYPALTLGGSLDKIFSAFVLFS